MVEPLVISAGTQVVTRVEVKDPETGAPLHPRGAVGVVVRAPLDGTHCYRVVFPDGVEAALKRADLDVHRDLKRRQIAEGVASPGEDLRSFVILRCVVGSRAYGLEGPDSDTDRRGIYLPPAERHWALYGVPEQLEDDATQECYWELEKFLVMALKANPNVLECLYSPIVEHATDLARELLALREVFLSRVIYQTYNGYVLSQFKKLGQDLRARGEVRWKHAMHLVRLLLAGTIALRDGNVPVRVPDGHRERLLAIRRGEVPWEEVDAWRLALHKELDRALATTNLPERPDYERANAFLVKARRSMVT